jgi:transcriptional regulator with XRE-family HTH domain
LAPPLTRRRLARARLYRDDGDEPHYREPTEGDEILAEFERTQEAWRRLGFTLGLARERMGLSKREAARRAGLSDGAWRHLEAGVKIAYGRTVLPNPRPENLVAAAKAVGLPPTKIFAIVGRQPPAGATEPTTEDQLAAEIRAPRPSDREFVEALIYRLSQS